MTKTRINTTIDSQLLKQVKEKVSIDGIKNINVLIEKALRFYFANASVSVWEKQCSGGWTRKLIIRPDILILENIRSRKSTKMYDRGYYTNDAMLEKDGWQRVWRIKSQKENQNEY